MTGSVKIAFIFSDGRRFCTELSAQVWLEKIKLSKVVDGRGEIYRMNLYPVEMLVPLDIAAEAIEDMLFMLPGKKIVDILRAAEERMKSGW